MNEQQKQNKISEKKLIAIEEETEMQIERITKAEAAKLLGVSPQTVSNHVRKGWLNQFKMGDSNQAKVFYKRSEVMAFAWRQKPKNEATA